MTCTKILYLENVVVNRTRKRGKNKQDKLKRLCVGCHVDNPTHQQRLFSVDTAVLRIIQQFHRYLETQTSRLSTYPDTLRAYRIDCGVVLVLPRYHRVL